MPSSGIPTIIRHDASHDSFDTNCSRTSTPLAEDKDLMNSTVVLSHSGHDLPRRSAFSVEKLRYSYAVAPSTSVIFVFLKPEARILKGLRDVLQMENPHLAQMCQ